DEAGAERLLARLDAEGVFGIVHLPDPRRRAAATGDVADALDGALDADELLVEVGEQEKRFDAKSGAHWMGELLAEPPRTAQETLWQLYPDPAREGEFRDEQARFAGLAPLERRREVKRLLIEALRRARGPARDELVVELRQVYGEVGVPAAAD